MCAVWRQADFKANREFRELVRACARAHLLGKPSHSNTHSRMARTNLLPPARPAKPSRAESRSLAVGAHKPRSIGKLAWLESNFSKAPPRRKDCRQRRMACLQSLPASAQTKSHTRANGNGRASGWPIGSSESVRFRARRRCSVVAAARQPRRQRQANAAH